MGLVVFCFIHHGTPTESFPESFMKIQLDLADIFRIKMFICLFVYFFIRLFLLNHPRTPTGSFPESFVKIRLNLAEIYRI